MKQEIESTIDIINVIVQEACCDDVREEHLKMIFDDFINEHSIDAEISNSLEGYSEFRKYILGYSDISASDKIGLIKKLHNS